MMAILREIAIYLIFVYLLLMVGYGNRDPWAGHFYRNVKNLLAHGHWSYGTNGFDLYNVCIIIRNIFIILLLGCSGSTMLYYVPHVFRLVKDTITER